MVIEFFPVAAQRHVSVMKSRRARVLLAGVVGLLLTAGCAAIAYLAHRIGSELTGPRVLLADPVLQSLIPLLNIGTSEHPIYEGTPLNILAFFASFPIGVGVYSIIAYITLSRWREW
jgi:hypothetical protein